MANATSTGKAIFQEDGDKTSSILFRYLNSEATDQNVAGFMAEACKMIDRPVTGYLRIDTKEITL